MKEDMAVSFNRRNVSEELSGNAFLDREDENVYCGFVLVIHAGSAHLCCFQLWITQLPRPPGPGASTFSRTAARTLTRICLFVFAVNLDETPKPRCFSELPDPRRRSPNPNRSTGKWGRLQRPLVADCNILHLPSHIILTGTVRSVIYDPQSRHMKASFPSKLSFLTSLLRNSSLSSTASPPPH